MITTEYISTFTGNRLYPDGPRIAKIDIEDIATGLSNICRFAGQVEEFYSVAQHSVIVASILPEKQQWAGLNHDISEAYLGDFVKPVKVRFPDFVRLEDDLTSLIAEEFGIDFSDYAPIKRADNIALKTEKRDMLPNSQENWDYLNGLPVLKDAIVPLSPRDARALFMSTFYRLDNLRKPQFVGQPSEPCANLLGPTQCLVSSVEHDLPADWIVMAAEKHIDGHKILPTPHAWHLVGIDSTAPDAMHLIKSNLKKNAAAVVRVSEGIKLEMATQMTDRHDQEHICGLVPRKRLAALDPYIHDLQGRNYEDMVSLALKAQGVIMRPMATPELLMPKDCFDRAPKVVQMPSTLPGGNRVDSVVSRLLKFRN